MASPSKPVIVLVHGAFNPPLCYRRLIDPLRSQGYTVLALTNASVGIDDSIAGKTHLDDVKRVHEVLLPYLDEGEEALMVCHNYGAMPGTTSLEGHAVDERAARGLKGGVRAVLYLAALAIPQRGSSAASLHQSQSPQWHRQERGICILEPQCDEIFYNDIPTEERKHLVAGLMHQSLASYVTNTVYVVADLGIPKTYVVCTEDRCIPPAAQQAMAAAAGAKVVELACGHSPQSKEPESKRVVELIMEMAR